MEHLKIADEILTGKPLNGVVSHHRFEAGVQTALSRVRRDTSSEDFRKRACIVLALDGTTPPESADNDALYGLVLDRELNVGSFVERIKARSGHVAAASSSPEVIDGTSFIATPSA